MIESLVTAAKWAMIVAAIVILIAGIVSFFGQTAEVGTDAMFKIQAAQKEYISSPSYTSSLVFRMFHMAFGDEWEPLSWDPVWTLIVSSVAVLGTLYMAYFAYRLLRVIVS